MSDRLRNRLILVLVSALLVGSFVIIATTKTRLGLDLQGGVELIYQGKPTPQQPEVTQEAIDRALEIMRKRVDKLGVAEPEIQRFGRDQISVGLPAVKNVERAKKQVGTVAQLFFYDWEANVIGPEGEPDPADIGVTGGQAAGQAGSLDHYAAVIRGSERKPQRNEKASQTDQVYLVNPSTQKVLAGPEDTRQDIIEELSPRSKLAQLLRANESKATKFVTVPQGTIVVKADREGLPDNAPDRYYVLNDNPALTGTDLKDPKQDFDRGAGGSGGPIVTFEFTSKGKDRWQETTKRLAQRGQQFNLPPKTPEDARQHFAAVLDNELVTVPFIDFLRDPEGIDGDNGASIEGSFTIGEAQDLAENLRIGALPIKLEQISETQVSASLGQKALDDATLAAGVGFAVVILFLLLFYRIAGVIAVAGLIIYAIYFFAMIKLVPITMTLPGIAGLILTIGVAADSNIVIFERIKEEIRGGASVTRGIATGYRKGVTSIIDANVVTLMTAFILFVLATSGVKGFAFTLGIGTIVSLFTAVLATQAILTPMARWRILSRPSAMGAGADKKPIRFDFSGASKWFFSMSGVILLIGALAIGAKGLSFGIDFESGTRVKAPLSQSASEDDVRAAVERAGVDDAKVQRVTEPEIGKNVFQISSKELKPAGVQRIRTELNQEFGVNSANFSSTSIGPTFGETVANSAIVAIIASLLVIAAYIAIRFEWKYAVPVLIALLHDLLITAGVYSLADREVTSSTVAALLTILGYSLYDCIIVFDRIRENVPRMPRAAFSQIVNRSMAEVLVRSVATGLGTAMLLISLLIFGGETLQDFAFALLVGVVSGAYSSIFIAAPVLTHWKERELVFRRRRERIAAEHGGVVPAYPDTGDVVEVEQKGKGRRITAPVDPTEVSREEFDEMVAELDAVPKTPEEIAEEEEREYAAAQRRTRTRSRSRRSAGDGDGGDAAPPAPSPPSGDGGNGGASPKPPPSGNVPKPPKKRTPRSKRQGRNK